MTALLPGIAITNATASFGYLLAALAVAGLTAASCSAIAQGVVEPRDAQAEAITLLYQISPVRPSSLTRDLCRRNCNSTFVIPHQVAVLTSAAACSLALVFSLPLAHSFFPPPGFGIFIILHTLISTITVVSLVIALHESTEPFRTARLIVPRNLLIVAIARLLGNYDTTKSPILCALALATLLQGLISDEVSTISRDGDASPWRQRSNSGAPTMTRRFSISSPRTDTPTSPRHVLLPSSPRAAHPPTLSPRKTLSPLIAFLPFLLLLLQSFLPYSYPTLDTTSLLPSYIANRIGLHSHVSLPYTIPTLDIVFSYYNEDLLTFSSYVDRVKRYGFVRKMKTRLVVYAKEVDEEVRRRRDLENLPEVDEVVYLENVGREGGTYLTHIVREFGEEGERTRIADLTLFLQHRESFSLRTIVCITTLTRYRYLADLAWNWLAEPRFDYVDTGRTAFIALGPYLKSDCGKDLLGNGEFTRMRDIYSMFREEVRQSLAFATSSRFRSAHSCFLGHLAVLPTNTLIRRTVHRFTSTDPRQPSTQVRAIARDAQRSARALDPHRGILLSVSWADRAVQPVFGTCVGEVLDGHLW